MVVSMSGVHLSVISIDVGSVWEVVFEAIRRKEAKLDWGVRLYEGTYERGPRHLS